MIDENRAFGHACESSCLTTTDSPKVVIIAYAGHDELGILGGGCGGRSRPALVLGLSLIHI